MQARGLLGRTHEDVLEDAVKSLWKGEGVDGDTGLGQFVGELGLNVRGGNDEVTAKVDDFVDAPIQLFSHDGVVRPLNVSMTIGGDVDESIKEAHVVEGFGGRGDRADDALG